MAYRYYHHPCGCHSHAGSTEPRCSACGKPGEFVRWGLGVVGGWCNYYRTFGLKAMSPNKKDYAKVHSLRRTCSACGGSGFQKNPERPIICYECEGAGAFWDASEEEIRDAYRRLLTAHPSEWVGQNLPTGYPFVEGLYLDARPAPGVPGVPVPEDGADGLGEG